MKKFFFLIFLIGFTCVLSIIIGASLYKYGYITKYNQRLDSYTDEIALSVMNLFTSQKTYETNNASQIKLISNNYEFNLSSYNLKSMETYGAIDIYNDKLFFLDGQGNLSFLDKGIFKEITIPKLKANLRNFNLDFGVNFPDFSIKDMIFGEIKNQDYVFVSYTEYDNINKCYFLSLASSKITLNEGELTFDDFSKIFQSQPCLKSHPEEGIRGFAGRSAGGRLSINKKGIFLSIGDFYFDGVNADNMTELSNSDYGKIIFIDFNSNNYEVVASGLRNPQGLVLTDFGLFETEHGPQGGDEFNKIDLEKKRNYGWPNASYGVDYETFKWPLDPSNLNHYSFQDPIYFWTPSIGVSNIDYFDNDSEFILWRGDFLISSLRALSLFRIRMDPLKENLIGVETINLGFRIRDLKIHENKVYLLEDTTPVKIHLLEKINHEEDISK